MLVVFALLVRVATDELSVLRMLSRLTLTAVPVRATSDELLVLIPLPMLTVLSVLAILVRVTSDELVVLVVLVMLVGVVLVVLEGGVSDEL